MRIKSRKITTVYLASLLGLLVCGVPQLTMARETTPSVQRPKKTQPVPVRGQPVRTQPPRQLMPRHYLQAQPTLPNVGLPGRRQPAGTRGPCFPRTDKLLTAIVPESNLGLTVAAYPTFFFYVPDTVAKAVEFVVIDEENYQKVYQKKFPITGKAGIFSLSLSDSPNSSPLKIGKKYHWYFSVVCDSQDPSGDSYVDGWVQRVDPNPGLNTELKNASLPQQIALYQKYNLWHEALTALAQQRRSRPNDPAASAEWARLMRSVGLDEIALEGFVVGGK